MKLDELARHMPNRRCNFERGLADSRPTCWTCGRRNAVKCTGLMLLRVNTFDRSLFWGCAHFPECRNTAPVTFDDLRALARGLAKTYGVTLDEASKRTAPEGADLQPASDDAGTSPTSSLLAWAYSAGDSGDAETGPHAVGGSDDRHRDAGPVVDRGPEPPGTENVNGG